MKIRKSSIQALLLVISPLGFAATQGSLSATSSTGTFTNTFGTPTLRQIQITGLLDAAVTNSSPITTYAGNQSRGVSDKFCVVDTTGGAVNLKISNSAGGSGASLTATNSAGTSLKYYFSLGLANAAVVNIIIDSGNFIVGAGSTVTSPAQCGAGNMVKAANLESTIATIPAGPAYSSVITMTATPR